MIRVCANSFLSATASVPKSALGAEGASEIGERVSAAERASLLQSTSEKWLACRRQTIQIRPELCGYAGMGSSVTRIYVIMDEKRNTSSQQDCGVNTPTATPSSAWINEEGLPM